MKCLNLNKVVKMSNGDVVFIGQHLFVSSLIQSFCTIHYSIKEQYMHIKKIINYNGYKITKQDELFIKKEIKRYLAT